jgi:hypothetical protein
MFISHLQKRQPIILFISDFANQISLLPPRSAYPTDLMLPYFVTPSQITFGEERAVQSS